MAKSKVDDQYREKFRPNADAALDAQVDAVLAGLSEEQLYADSQARGAAGEPGDKNVRRGKIISITPDDALVDFGGKSQGVISLVQFEHEPVSGQEMDFVVDRYDPSEGLLILSLKGAWRPT